MKKLYQFASVLFLLFICFSCNKPATEKTESTDLAEAEEQQLAAGRQPQVSVDPAGIVRIVYGHENKIYCATSSDQGKSFSKPQLVGQIDGLYLGMAMGPQIASSANFSKVTAIDKKGNIHSFSLEHNTAEWVKIAAVNDVAGVAPEGLMTLDAAGNDRFYATWLDVRNDKQNKIVFASTTGKDTTWSDNKIIYISPDKTVCECCKPSMDVKGNNLVIMFRNWVNGSRDFYFTTSADGGATFSEPVKLGKGTWKLEGCPMDGGGILIDAKNKIHTVWQRDGHIFYAQPDSKEVEIGKGRNVRISGTQNPVISWKDGKELKVKLLASEQAVTVGTGSYIETAVLADTSILSVWENEGAIFYKKI